MSKQVTFMNWKCDVVFAEYPDASTAIQLKDAETGEPVATASVNLHESMFDPNYMPDIKFSEDLPPRHCYIKTWSENEGLLEALIESDIVEYAGRLVPVGPYGSTAALVKIKDEK